MSIPQRIKALPLPVRLKQSDVRAQRVTFGPMDERRMVRVFIGDRPHDLLPPMPRGVRWALTDDNHRVAHVDNQHLRSGDWVVYFGESDEPRGIISEKTFDDLFFEEEK